MKLKDLSINLAVGLVCGIVPIIVYSALNNPRCLHEGRLDRINYKNTYRVNLTAIIPNAGDTVELGVCKICGAMTDIKCIRDYSVSHLPIQASGEVLQFFASRSKRAQEYIDHETKDFVSKMRAATNALVISDSCITAGVFNQLERANPNRFFLVQGCTFTEKCNTDQAQVTPQVRQPPATTTNWVIRHNVFYRVGQQ